MLIMKIGKTLVNLNVAADNIPYELIGSLPSYDRYTDDYYQFKDTMATGLTFENIDSCEIISDGSKWNPVKSV